VLEEKRPQASTLVGVVDNEGNFGRVPGLLAVVPGHGHDLVTELSHDHDVLVLVDLRQPLGSEGERRRDRREEA
jgi:hypothetical protein